MSGSARSPWWPRRARRPGCARLPEPVCLLGGLVALLLYLNLAFSNARSFLHVLPTLASTRQLWDLAGQGFNEASRYAPPVPELRGMLLLTAGGIGIAALLTDWIAVRLGSAALAGLPLLLLFMEPFTLSVGRGFLGTTVAFCAGVGGYLALLSSEGKDRIREWEHQDPSARDAPDTRALAAAGRRVGFASVVLALFLPLVIPGLHVTRLFGGQPGIGGRAGSGPGRRRRGERRVPRRGHDALAAAHPGAQRPAGRRARVPTTQTSPDYLQIYVLDQLTDSGWRLFGQPESTAHVDPAMPAPPGLTNRPYTTEVNTTIRIASDVGPDDLGALPVPYPAVSVRATGDLEADRSTLMLFDQGTRAGRPAVLGHQPVRLAARAGAQRRAAAARRHRQQLPGGARLLRLAARAGGVRRRQRRGEDPVREGRRTAELAG